METTHLFKATMKPHNNLAEIDSDIYDRFGEDGADFIHELIEKCIESEGTAGVLLIEELSLSSLQLQIIGYLVACFDINVDSGHVSLNHEVPK